MLILIAVLSVILTMPVVSAQTKSFDVDSAEAFRLIYGPKSNSVRSVVSNGDVIDLRWCVVNQVIDNDNAVLKRDKHQLLWYTGKTKGWLDGQIVGETRMAKADDRKHTRRRSVPRLCCNLET